MTFSIVYLSEQVVIVVKPHGLSFHKTEDQPGFVHEFRRSLVGHPEYGGLAGTTLFPVHRLDAVTSGMVVFARSKESARGLSTLFASGQIEKRYVALSERKPTKKQGLVIGDMQKSRRGMWKLSRSKQNPAKTRFQSVSLGDQRPGLRMYLLHPITGRTHQLRVAMKSFGAPILGDHLYAQSDAAAEEERTYLHACGLKFLLNGEEVEVVHQPDQGAEFCAAPFRAAWSDLGNLFGDQ